MMVSGPQSDVSLWNLPRNSEGLAITSDALEQLRKRLPAFLEELVATAGAERLVIALDSGVESSVAAAVAVDAIGANRVTGLVLPAFMSDEATARNAEAVATALGIEHTRLQLQPIVTALQESVSESNGPTDDLIATNNALSRLRMTAMYYVANTMDALVVGTVNRTDYLLGSITKHGDTGADCLLLGDLYRTEVKTLADEMGLPEEITVDGSRWPFPTDQSPVSELDVTIETIDQILRLHVDQDVEAVVVADHIDVDPSVVERIADWCAQSRHKRQPLPTPARYSMDNSN